MFRLTWDGPEALWKTVRPVGEKTQRQRVYRWEHKWGCYIPATGVWCAEARIPVQHGQRDGTRFLLETVEPMEDEAPPFHVDDAWEEEVVAKGSVTAGMSMSIKGDAKTILAWYETHGLGFFPGLASSLTARRDESNIFGSVLSK